MVFGKCFFFSELSGSFPVDLSCQPLHEHNRKLFSEFASGIQSKVLVRRDASILPLVDSSKYQSWMEIPVTEVMEQTSAVNKITVEKMPQADDSHPEAWKGLTVSQ